MSKKNYLAEKNLQQTLMYTGTNVLLQVHVDEKWCHMFLKKVENQNYVEENRAQFEVSGVFEQGLQNRIFPNVKRGLSSLFKSFWGLI